MTQLKEFLDKYLSVSFADIRITDILEMVIIAFLLYEIMLWIKKTRVWVLLKGFLVLIGFIIVATLFEMNTILWIAGRVVDIGILALVIIFQPELRRALEQLGQNNVFTHLIQTGSAKNRQDKMSEQVIDGIVDAAFAMSRSYTGALIVLEREIPLTEYIETGISIDGIVSGPLLLNIFEHNTPLHDGAVIIRQDRIAAATCYLPLSDNMELSKRFGTRHRAGVGISEVSDALVIIVSEETGDVSFARDGKLHPGISVSELRQALQEAQKYYDERANILKRRRGRRAKALS